MILIIDFGSQTAHLIERRIKSFGVRTTFLPPEKAIKFFKRNKVTGIILSGGPASVYAKNAPVIDPEIYTTNTPLLAICYGMQLMLQQLGGKVVSGKKEYGPSELNVQNANSFLTKNLPKKSTVWMSHGDEVISLPDGFEVVGNTNHVPFAVVTDQKRNLFGMLFHPEVEHTDQGDQIIKNFVDYTNSPIEKREIDLTKIQREIREIVGDSYVIGAVSGGVDSTVAAAFMARAIGKKFIPFYVDNGLMRDGTTEHVKSIFKHIGVPVDILSVEEEMLRRLKGIKDPERKRKVIGKYYIELFEKEMIRLRKSGKDVKFLLQGTIYSDVIESKGTKHASKIKSHHNVGGLPKNMKLKLIEPLKTFYKDEVRLLGEKLGLPEEFVWQQPFPGPGFAVRIRGDVTKERLEKQKIADKIILEELKSADLLRSVFISFPVLTGAESTAVKGDGRFFGEVIAIRVVESRDVMTAVWARLPYEVLQKMASRIVNEVPGISRVVYDITTKPPATMEWE